MHIEETMPFPPPLVRRGTPTTGTRAVARHERERAPAAPRDAVPSLEQLTEARLAELRNQHFLRETPAPVTAQEETPRQPSRQMVLASASPEESSLVALRWRGMPVSPEFQVYALRVARGEDLAPYRGPILADASLALPWEAADAAAVRKAPRRAGRSLFIFAALATVAAFVLPNLAAHSPELIAVPPPALAPAPSELAVPAPTVPGPFVLESAAPPVALPPTLASAPSKARARAFTRSAASTPSVAQRPSTGTLKHAAPAPAAAPANAAATGPSPLLIDRPSF